MAKSTELYDKNGNQIGYRMTKRIKNEEQNRMRMAQYAVTKSQQVESQTTTN